MPDCDDCGTPSDVVGQLTTCRCQLDCCGPCLAEHRRTRCGEVDGDQAAVDVDVETGEGSDGHRYTVFRGRGVGEGEPLEPPEWDDGENTPACTGCHNGCRFCESEG